MFPKSIRFKFILWYALLLALTFSLFSLILYFNFQKALKVKIDELLLSKAEGIRESIDTYWEVEKLEALKDGANLNLLTKADNVNFAKIARRWVKERSSDPELMDIAIEICQPNGAVIAYSENLQFEPFLPREIIEHTLKGADYFYNCQIKDTQENLAAFRALAVAVSDNNKIAYIVQVLGPLVQMNVALNRLRLILFVLLPLTVLTASFLAGEFLAGIILKPLNKMMITARQISAENMSLRIAIPDTKDEIRKLANTFNDMLDKIYQSFSSQKRFVQDVSHELRTPLTILKGELEVALKRGRSKEEYSSVLQSNLEEINRIIRMVENLLLLARFENEEVSLNKEPVDIRKLLNDIKEETEVLARQKSLTVRINPGEDFILELDREKFRRVILNLLDNAIKYTPAGGRISMDLEKKDDRALIKVADTGIGISRENLPFIFDRFFQADKARSGPGFGLGLCIVKSILNAHGGEIQAESILKQGSAFTIQLPLTS